MEVTREEVKEFISGIFKIERAEFSTAIRELRRLLEPWDLKTVLHHLETLGLIPENFEHDSTEEKLYGKYCDITVAGFLEIYNFKTEVLEKRGDWPNIKAYCEKYFLIADPKAFRESRTAINPKDLKIETLGGRWRKRTRANYAFIVSSRYPTKSRIFQEAVESNVVLLSYKHLHFIASQYGNSLTCAQFLPLWTFPSSFLPTSITGGEYWERLEELLRKLA